MKIMKLSLLTASSLIIPIQLLSNTNAVVVDNKSLTTPEKKEKSWIPDNFNKDLVFKIKDSSKLAEKNAHWKETLTLSKNDLFTNEYAYMQINSVEISYRVEYWSWFATRYQEHSLSFNEDQIIELENIIRHDKTFTIQTVGFNGFWGTGLNIEYKSNDIKSLYEKKFISEAATWYQIYDFKIKLNLKYARLNEEEFRAEKAIQDFFDKEQNTVIIYDFDTAADILKKYQQKIRHIVKQFDRAEMYSTIVKWHVGDGFDVDITKPSKLAFNVETIKGPLESSNNKKYFIFHAEHILETNSTTKKINYLLEQNNATLDVTDEYDNYSVSQRKLSASAILKSALLSVDINQTLKGENLQSWFSDFVSVKPITTDSDSLSLIITIKKYNTELTPGYLIKIINFN